MKIRLRILLFATLSVAAAVSELKSDNISSTGFEQVKFRKEKLFYNFWIPLPGIGSPTQPPGGTEPPPTIQCNTSTILTTPTCSCGGPTCLMGQVCVDPASSMTCTTPQSCPDMAVVTTTACTCGTDRTVCSMGQLCVEARSECLAACLDTTTYTMPCSCGTAGAICGMNAATSQACTIATSDCTTPPTCAADGSGIGPYPCICAVATATTREFVCPDGGNCPNTAPGMPGMCTIPRPARPVPVARFG